ncbi:MAG TPA: hypothetical protein DD671_14185 [Balneolaceae bacterium]|nr:hypothetical protein [Balneola sp.]HBQ60725.1 hypothetical protein [Balneolaceae bacterium]|tara:strand:- start:32545 stop:33609 length:1065 start_codon:yes stop_codon:yes gene_type:complete
MNRLTIISFLVLLCCITSCDIFGDRGGSETEEIPAFEWEKAYRFASNNITFIHITPGDELFVGTVKSWHSSSDHGKTFTYHSVPDSVIFKIVKKFGDEYYAIGEYDTEVSVFGSPTTVKSDGIFRSSNGSDWEQLLGPFWMYDIILDDHQYLYIAKYLGVSRLHIPTMKETIMEFMPEGSNPEFANVLLQNDQGEIFVGTDRGLYHTKDQGENWERLIQGGGSFLDDIEEVEVTGDMIIAISTKELHQSKDDGETWNSDPIQIHGVKDYYNPDYYYRDVDFTPTGELYTSTSYGVGVGKPDSLSKLYIAGPEGYDLENSFTYSRLEVFSNGDVAVANGTHVLIGTRNAESDFWN